MTSQVRDGMPRDASPASPIAATTTVFTITAGWVSSREPACQPVVGRYATQSDVPRSVSTSLVVLVVVAADSM